MSLFVIIILCAQGCATLALFFSALYLISKRPSKAQIELLITVIGTILMMLGYSIEITSTSMEMAYTGVLIGYLGKPYVMVATFAFIADYCEFKVSKRLIQFLCLFFFIILLIIATNQYTHLYYKNIYFDHNSEFARFTHNRGPVYYVYMASVIIYTGACLYMSIKEMTRTKNKVARIQIFLIFMTIFSGILGYGIYLLGITKGYDSTIFGCVVSTAFLMYLFIRYKIIDVMNLAKEKALEDVSTGLIVFDLREVAVYKNESIKSLLKVDFSAEELLNYENGENIARKGDKVYSIDKNSIISGGKQYGVMIEVRDVTIQYTYAERLEHDVEERTHEIKEIQRSIIAGIANIVEARDDDTGSHVKRTSEYARIIAENLRDNGVYTDVLTDDFINALYDVAPLHDIGKIKIPDSILLKPEKLNTDEMKIMKTHARSGSDMIVNIMYGIETEEYVSLASDVALYHHEKWDGSGYPCALKGNEIPLSARIMAIADVYDAVRSKRPYKEACDKQTSCEIIMNGSGNHFDPKLVEAFIRSRKIIESVDK